MRMDKALLLLLGGIAVVFVLIPDHGAPTDPVAPKSTEKQVAAAPQAEASQPAVYGAELGYDTPALVGGTATKYGAVPVGPVVRQSIGSTSPFASFEERRAQAFSDEQAYQAHYRGS
jgi:hypothetical protein